MQVFLGIPAYSRTVYVGLLQALMIGNKAPVRLFFHCSSFLTKAFNDIWCQALNHRKNGVTHLCLIHNDVIPGNHFIDTLLQIMAKTKADVVSAVIPLKSGDGLTSTALERPNYFAPRRFTLTEIHAQEPTFTDPALLINTGLMLVDFQKPWVEEIAQQGAPFSFLDTVQRHPNGDYYPASAPEDWEFSRKAKRLGATLYATREVSVIHQGDTGFPNNVVWGNLTKDRVD